MLLQFPYSSPQNQKPGCPRPLDERPGFLIRVLPLRGDPSSPISGLKSRPLPPKAASVCPPGRGRDLSVTLLKDSGNAHSPVVFIADFRVHKPPKAQWGAQVSDSRCRTPDKTALRHTVHLLPGYQLLFFISPSPSLLQEGRGLFHEIFPCYRYTNWHPQRLCKRHSEFLREMGLEVPGGCGSLWSSKQLHTIALWCIFVDLRNNHIKTLAFYFSLAMRSHQKGTACSSGEQVGVPTDRGKTGSSSMSVVG